MVKVENLKKYYGDVKAVDSISFSVRKQEIFGILGPNGAGKTTTLEVIEGLREPDSGKILIDNHSVWPNPAKTQQIIGVQLQSTALFDYLTVIEMLKLFASFYKRTLSEKEMDHLLDDVGLREKTKATISELSGGQQQRLSIALSLVNDPMIVFLDEPTTGLDPQARRHLWEVVKRLNAEGKTILITTHYIEEAEVLCKRVAVMDHGHIIALDTPENLIDSLGKETKITFTSNKSLDEADLKKLPGVTEVIRAENSYKLYTKQVERAIVKVLAMAHDEESPLENLSIEGDSLEDVFLHLTGRELRD